MPRISAVINTCNEAHHLKECIESLRYLADEIIVTDMESTDGSAQLAQQLGCKVIPHKRMAKPVVAHILSINGCTGDWVLIFDPDMRISEATAKRLRQIVEDDEADIVDFHCDNYFFGCHCPHGFGSQPVFRKFFKKSNFSPVDASTADSHSFFTRSTQGRVLVLPRKFAITHRSYPTIEKMVEVLSRYAIEEAEKAFVRGERSSVWKILWKPFKRFIGNYFLRKGFLDGVPGLIFHLGISWYTFLAQAHLWSIYRRNQKSVAEN